MSEPSPSDVPVQGATAERTGASGLGDAIEAWKERGRDLNALYDALTMVVEEPAPGFDPVDDLKALGAQRDRYRDALTAFEKLLSGALSGHHPAEPYSFSRGESADIEIAQEIARRKDAVGLFEPNPSASESAPSAEREPKASNPAPSAPGRAA